MDLNCKNVCADCSSCDVTPLVAKKGATLNVRAN